MPNIYTNSAKKFTDVILKEKQAEIILSSRMGFEFEFYSNHSVKETATLLSRVLNKKISVQEKSHSDFSPSENHYKIEPDMSGGLKLLELVTGSLPYQDARMEFIKIMKWITEHGKTGPRCGMHINVSFDPDKHGRTFLSHMNVLKFILEFDEDFIYDMFPDREGSVYAKSIKYIVPKDKYQFDKIENINPYNFIFPSEKYYGVNFQKLVKNYLEFRYLGGDGYNKRTNDILKLIDHFILELYKSAAEPNFTRENYAELKKILNKYSHMTKAYISFENFKESYPDVGFLVDLDSDDRRIKLFWGKIRDQLFSLLNECGLKDGVINYNSDNGRLQLKGADLSNSFKIENIDLVGCKVRGVITKCDIFDCDVQDAEIYECNLFSSTVVKGSKVMDSYTNRTAKLINCYVDGKNSIMNGRMEGGILRNSKITNLSSFDDKVERVEYEKIKTNPYVKS